MSQITKYTKGEVRIALPTWKDNDGEDRYDGFGLEKYKGQAYLPHSCDEWIVGGRKEVEQLIEDLQELLTKPELIYL